MLQLITGTNLQIEIIDCVHLYIASDGSVSEGHVYIII